MIPLAPLCLIFSLNFSTISSSEPTLLPLVSYCCTYTYCLDGAPAILLDWPAYTVDGLDFWFEEVAQVDELSAKVVPKGVPLL